MMQRELRALLADKRGSSTLYCNLPKQGARSRCRTQLQPTDESMSEQEEEVSMVDRSIAGDGDWRWQRLRTGERMRS